MEHTHSRRTAGRTHPRVAQLDHRVALRDALLDVAHRTGHVPREPVDRPRERARHGNNGTTYPRDRGPAVERVQRSSLEDDGGGSGGYGRTWHSS